MRRCRRAAVLLLAVTACDDPIAVETRPDGRYPLATVNGLPLPQSHVVSDGCAVMFGSGVLLIPSHQTFHIELSYGYACPDESTGHDVLVFHGSLRGTSTNLTLDDAVEGALLTARVEGEFIRLLFTGPHRVVWNDPAFRFGPWEPLVPGDSTTP